MRATDPTVIGHASCPASPCGVGSFVPKPLLTTFYSVMIAPGRAQLHSHLHLDGLLRVVSHNLKVLKLEVVNVLDLRENSIS